MSSSLRSELAVVETGVEPESATRMLPSACTKSRRFLGVKAGPRPTIESQLCPRTASLYNQEREYANLSPWSEEASSDRML